MIVQSFVHRLPRVLGVASSLLYKCNDAINTFGCKQSFSQSINTHQFCFPNPKVTGHIEPVRGLLQFPRQGWNLTSIRPYGSRRFTPENLTEAEIITAIKHYPDRVALWFSRKKFYKDREFSDQFRQEVGDKLVTGYLAEGEEFLEQKKTRWLVTALSNLKYKADPSFPRLAEFLLLLKWISLPPRDELISIAQLVLPFVSALDNKDLASLLHTWCKDNQAKQVAGEILMADTFLKECQEFVPKLDVKDMTLFLEAVSICVPFVQLPPGWLEDVQKHLLSIDCQAKEAAALLLDGFEQIQRNCSPNHHQLSIPVAKRMFEVWFDADHPAAKESGTLTCLVLRAMGEIGIDPGSLDERYWPWLWKEIDQLFDRILEDEWADDGRLKVLVALDQLGITAPPNGLQEILLTVKIRNIKLAAPLLSSVVRNVKDMDEFRYRMNEDFPAFACMPGGGRIKTKSDIMAKKISLLCAAYAKSLGSISGNDLVLGVWSIHQLGGYDPMTTAQYFAFRESYFWKQFYKHSECHLNQLTSDQLNKLLIVFVRSPEKRKPPVTWLKTFLAAFDKTPPHSECNPGYYLGYFKSLHERFAKPDRETIYGALIKNEDLLHVFTENMEERILKFYNHWLNEMEEVKDPKELLDPLFVMDYFDLVSKVSQSDIERWCKCREKYIGAEWRVHYSKPLYKMLLVYGHKFPHRFLNKILNEYMSLLTIEAMCSEWVYQRRNKI